MSKPAVQASDALEPAEAVLKFLASVGTSSEAEFYLRLFRERAPESFATIAVEAAAIAIDADGVATDLRFLSALELTPVVVLGMDRPDDASEQRETLELLLRAYGLRTQALAIDEDYSHVIDATRRGAIPLLIASDPDAGGRLEALARLLSALRTHKLIFLGPQGGLAQRGERLEVVNLSTDYDALHASGELDLRQHELLEDSRRLICELVPHRLLASITSPLNLLHELFTVKGAGTLLRSGVRITRHAGWTGVDREQLQALLDTSFDRRVSPQLFERPLAHAYVEESYRGAALVLATPLGGYLSKFAVTREAQGEGIGQDLWNALSSDYPALIWRARSDNPIRSWYERKCQARFVQDAWTVYARGIQPGQLAAAIEFALSQPVDL